MDEDRLTRAEAIFQDAADLPPAERGALLDERCADDAELRELVERLLARHDHGMGSFLKADNGTVRVDPEQLATPPRPGEQIGPYRILEYLGEGGFGEVVAAEQTAPVRRRVALKILKAGMDTRQVLARFEAERQALALMDHPNIARVLDAGETPRGRPYFVMDLLEGEPITKYCDRHRLTLEERLDLFLAVCRAIQHAHQKGVIHRDVKPSNVLVTIVDGEPVPRVIDFGIAKATAQALTERTLYTGRGQILGTPAYMSPEQAEMAGHDVDTRADVYSLGVLLYELLTGRLPFDSKTLRETGLETMCRIIREKEPPRPSTRVSTLGEGARQAAARRRTDPAHWRKALRRELDWIVMKALEKDRNRRYETVSGLAADVERYLADQPVLAGPPSTGYRMQKYVKRHRIGVGFASVIGLGLVLAFVLVTIQNTRIAEARDEAQAVTTTLGDMLASVDPSKSGREVTVRQMLDDTAPTLGESFRDQPLVEAELRHVVGNTYFALGVLDTAEVHLRRTVEIREERLGKEHPETLAARNDLALTYQVKGRYPEKEILAEETLAIARRVLGEEHPVTLNARRQLASALSGQGHYEQAEVPLREGLPVARRAFGEEHPETLQLLGSLATIYSFQERFEEAETIEREILEVCRRTLGNEHPETLGYMQSLAATCWHLERYGEAEALQREALAIQRRILGEEHPMVLRAMGNLAVTYLAQKRYEEAEALCRETLEIQRRTLGEDHPANLPLLLILGSLHHQEGRYDAMAEVYEAGLEISRRKRGEDHPTTLDFLSGVAITYAFQGRLEEAETLQRELLATCRRVLGDGHTTTNSTRYNLACNLALQDRRREAVALLREAVDHGYVPWYTSPDEDPDLDSLRGDPEFEALVEELGRDAEAAGAAARSE